MDPCSSLHRSPPWIVAPFDSCLVGEGGFACTFSLTSMAFNSKIVFRTPKNSEGVIFCGCIM